MNLIKYRFYIFLSIVVVTALTLLHACANIGRPTGGPIDELPPVYLTSNPLPGQMNVKPERVVIEFDENIKLNKVNEKVVVSPPQKEQPTIKSNGRRLTVQFNDSLIDNTTYSIDFSDAIQDNNESNPLENFSFSFSTGAGIDTLKISGKLLNAADLEPITGTYVGLQSNLEDSAFTTRPFIRISKTDALGNFSIKNVAPGSYRLYALKDINNNYLFDLPTEDIAFYDSIVVPTVEMKLHNDTIYKDSVTVDTIISYIVPHFYPDDIVLLSFNENKKQLYFEKAERQAKNKAVVYFSAPQESLPVLKGLNFDASQWAVVESTPAHDTITYWIKDTLISGIDTLQLTMTHLYTDSLWQLSEKTDTLTLFERKMQKRDEPKKKKKDQEEQDSTVYLNFSEKIAGMMNIGERPTFIFEEPIVDIDASRIRVEMMKDSVYMLQPSRLEQSPENIRKFILNARYSAGETYLITIDSAAVKGLYGAPNKAFSKQMKVKSVEEFGHLLVKLPGLKEPAFVELLNGSDKVVRTATVKNQEAKFMLIAPGTYYLRLIVDKNSNGEFDTGNYAEKRQPETVLYYNEPIEVRANWEISQEWDINALPVSRQKPLAITKNKPKEKKNDKDATKNTSSMQYGGGTVTGTVQR